MEALRAGQAIRLAQRDWPSILQVGFAFNNSLFGAPELQLAKWGSRSHDSDGTRAAGNQGGAAVEVVQATLGEVLLVLAGLAVVLLAVILVLAEVDLILRLGRRLAGGRRRPQPPTLVGGRHASGERAAERVPGEQGGR
jgi:hypothetical protein